MIIKTQRSKRKTMSLQVIDNQTLLVKAPLRLKDEQITAFVKSKARWIEKTLLKMDEKSQFKNSFDFEHNLYLFGQEESLSDFNLALNLPKNSQSILIYDGIYKDYAKKYLPKRAEELSKQTGFSYKQLKLSKSKHYWGSYSKNGNMHLNFKLIVLPKELIDYVIIHELCHSKHFNHSQNFWTLVKSFCPNYKTYKKQLDQYGFLL